MAKSPGTSALRWVSIHQIVPVGAPDVQKWHDLAAMRTLLLSMLLLGASALAQEGTPPPQTAAERFNALPEAEKQALREKLKAFKALPPEERERIKANLQRFKALPPEDQQRVRENLKHFMKLSPEERQDLREKHKAFRQLPPEERREMRQKLRQYLRENPEARERMRCRTSNGSSCASAPGSGAADERARADGDAVARRGDAGADAASAAARGGRPGSHREPGTLAEPRRRGGPRIARGVVARALTPA